MITIEAVEELKTTKEGLDLKVAKSGNTRFISFNGVTLVGTVNKSDSFYEGYIKGFRAAMNMK